MIRIAYFMQKVEFRPKQGNSFGEAQYITDFYNFQINKGIAEKQDTFQFNVINSNNRYNQGDIKFKIGDKIRVYMWKNKATPDNTDIIIDGFIQKQTQTISDKGKIIQITGKNVLEFLFSTPVFLDTQEDGALTAPQIIEKIIKDINNKNTFANTGLQIKYTGPSSTGTISTLKSDKTAITKTHESLQDYWKKATLLIEDYSGPNMTGDEYPHMAYVDVDSNGELMFYWQPRKNEVTTTNIVEGVEPSQIKTGYKSEVINAIIANCGLDPRNHGITVFVADYPSINRNGAKWKYFGKHRNKAEDMVNHEIQSTTKTSVDGAGNAASFGDKDKFPSAYNYNTYWKSSRTDTDHSPTCTAGSSVTITSNSDWVAAVRRESKWLVTDLVESELRGTFDPKFIVDIELPGIPSYALGNYIPHTITSNGFVAQENLRLVSLSHSFWNSGMTSEEDSPGGVT